MLVTDKMVSYGAAMKIIGNADKQETGRWMKNQVNANPVKIRRCPRVRPQPLQPRMPPLFTR